MQVQLESTTKIVELIINGVPIATRVWEGVTANGVRCHAFITRIAVHNDDDHTEFARELKEQAAPTPAVAVFLSIGIQHGVPLALYLDAMKGMQFLPSGSVANSEAVQEAASILDYLAQEIERSYPGGRRAPETDKHEATAVPEKVGGAPLEARGANVQS